MNRKLVMVLLAGGAISAIGVRQTLAQDPDADPAATLRGYFTRIPWTGGTSEDAQFQAAAGTTIPMSPYVFTAPKDGLSYGGQIVGTNPAAGTLAGTTINAVIIPLKVTIGTAVFDPSAPNSCDSNVSASIRFALSPLVQNVPNLTFNGVDVGNTQYVNGFRRAEFWSLIGGSSAYQNPVVYNLAATSSLTAGTHGKTFLSGCALLGLVSNTWLDNELTTTVMPALTASGVVSPTKFVIFLLKNVVQTTADPPNILQCCILGYHAATGTPVQTYTAVMWDTSGLFGNASKDGSAASHEIAEWMDDPLGTNASPPWGNIGQVLGCQSNWENGDPLTGKLMPPITLFGKAYHMQELAFFSWYFNSNGLGSLGTGGKFSGNGTFTGPSKACPPGGTF